VAYSPRRPAMYKTQRLCDLFIWIFFFSLFLYVLFVCFFCCSYILCSFPFCTVHFHLVLLLCYFRLALLFCCSCLTLFILILHCSLLFCVICFHFVLFVATPLWPSVGVKPNTWKSWRFGVLWNSRMFRARQQGPKHLALRCSWCHCKGLET